MNTDNQTTPASPRDPTRAHIDDISRRRFIAVASCGCACAATRPSPVLGAEPRPVNIGTRSDYPKDGISDRFVQDGFFVIRRDGRLYASSATCTHMTEPLLVDAQDATRIKCSSHGSVFDDEGRAAVGPASQSLARLAISLDAQDCILVDPARRFAEDKWDDKNSYLALE